MPDQRETVRAYSARWVLSREGRVGNTGYNESHLRLHVLPTLIRGKVRFGELPISDISPNDLREVVGALDQKVAKGGLGWKSAANVWSTVTKMFDDATRHKDPSLHALLTNPSRDVRGPDKGPSKALQYLYPSEFETLARSPSVPLRARQMYTILVYGYMRVGELEALLHSDVDLEHKTLSITKAVKRETGEIKSTKAGQTRRIPIDAHLFPLLRALLAKGKRGRRGDFWLPPAEDRAELLRRHLELAGIARPALFVNTPWSRHITAHDLRATGITWAAVRGDEHLKIMQRAGHEDSSTSMRYIREAENLREGFGNPFPKLPQEVIS
jgi:integrase